MSPTPAVTGGVTLLRSLNGRTARVQRLDGTAGRQAARGTLWVSEDSHARTHTGETKWTVTLRQPRRALLGAPAISFGESELIGCGAVPTADGLVVGIQTSTGGHLRVVVGEAIA
ncbi:hypothetical protein [Baekduia alba]|uniref:hypothetical protein n=1 Tax=Baekduia alba TaxID=2997333 RepID=UPI0023401EA9|nr:hypothetical protein [Baekduia alba]